MASKVCKSFNEYIGELGNSGDKLVIAEFSADWSIPSQVLSQELDLLLQSYPLLTHLKVNFNNCPELFQRYKINILPCVKFIKTGVEIAEVRGSNISQIKQRLESYYLED